MTNRTLSETFQQILETYPEPAADSRGWNEQALFSHAAELIGDRIDNKYLVTTSQFGAAIPYIPVISISHPNEGRGTTEGLSVTYLFDVVANRVCLTLSQSAVEAKQEVENSSPSIQPQLYTDKTWDLLESRTSDLQNAIQESQLDALIQQGFGLQRLYFDASLRSDYNELYDTAVVVNRTYSGREIPDSDSLVSDLQLLINSYGRIADQSLFTEIKEQTPTYSTFWYEREPYQPSEEISFRIACIEHREAETIQFEVYDLNEGGDGVRIQHKGRGFASTEGDQLYRESGSVFRVVPPDDGQVIVNSDHSDKTVGVIASPDMEQKVNDAIEALSTLHQSE